jgi:formylglycine-generating enzyme required for sulfatase activity
MSGNVREWCEEWDDSSRYLMGGDYTTEGSSYHNLRVGLMDYRSADPDNRGTTIGFRVARKAPTP